MKVLMIGSDLDVGGIGNVIMNLYRALTKKHIQCDLCYYSGSKPSSQLMETISNDGNTVYELMSVKQAGLFKYIWQIKKICDLGKYDVIHIHTSLLSWMAALAAMLSGVKVRVAHAHGAKFLNYSEKVLLVLEPVGKLLNRVFCTDFATCSEASALYNFGRKAVFLANFIDANDILNVDDGDIERASKEIIKNRNYDYVFGYTGSLDGVKNVIFLLDVINSLKKSGVNPLLVLAGRTSFPEQFKAKINDLGIAENIAMLGHRSDCKVLVQLFDYFISASTTEGMSVSMIEAQMSGKPCFASALIPPESDLHIGLFHQIEGYNSDQWANEIMQRINNGFTKISREDAANKLNQTECCESAVVEKLIEIYKK